MERELKVFPALALFLVVYILFASFGVWMGWYKSEKEFAAAFLPNLAFAIAAWIAYLALHDDIELFEKEKRWPYKK